MNRKLKLEELNRLSVEEYKQAEKLPVILVLNNIRSLQNVGSVFRTADAFRCEEIWLQGITAKPPHREINKTALGATNSVDWRYFEREGDVIEMAAKQNIKLISLEHTEQSQNISEFKPQKEGKYALVLGNEVDGVGSLLIENSDHCLEIPQHGTKHSLNVTISAGIAIWDFYQKLKS